MEPTETIVQCPIEGKIQKLTNYQEDTPLKVRNSMDDSLCALFLVSESGKKIPVARSYLGNDWEAYAGQYSHQAFTCNSSVCETTLPALSTEKKNYLGSYHFEITSFQHSIPEKDQVARFLEQTTFGPTVSEIELFPGSFAAWVQQQQEIPLSSHRAFYREHLNNRYDAPTPMGIPTHACDKGTRYRKYAITSDSDRKKKIEIKTDQGTGRKIILVDGAVRTSIDATVLYAGSPDDNMVYQDGM